MNDSEKFAAGLLALKKKLNLGSKTAFAPTGSMPPPDPSMMGGAGAPPMDPAMMGGGAPPMDPAMMGGAGAPPMDPAMMGGGAPMDPAMMGGAPPMDPAMMGGAPPMDPSMMGAPPADPASMGVMQPPQEDPMEVLLRIEGKLDELIKLMKEPQGEDAKSLLPREDAGKVEQAEREQEEAEEPLSPEAADAVENGESSFLRNQIKSLGGQA